jgi:hypothetical protein
LDHLPYFDFQGMGGAFGGAPGGPGRFGGGVPITFKKQISDANKPMPPFIQEVRRRSLQRGSITVVAPPGGPGQQRRPSQMNVLPGMTE